MLERRRRLLVAASLMATSWRHVPVWAFRAEPKVVLGSDGPGQRQILKVLQARYPGLVSDASVPVLQAHRPGGVYVSVGPQALESALAAELDGPLLSVFTSREAYERLLKAAPARTRKTVLGIYAEASPTAQLQLIAAIFERRVTVGVLLGEASAALERLIRQGAESAGLDVEIVRVPPSADVLRELARLGRADVLLALPDSNLYTANKLRLILESTYRRGQPMIGFSTSMVAAGTLATAYASIGDIVVDLAETVDAVSVGHMSEVRYPKYWRVVVNDSVAQSLDVPIGAAVRAMGDSPKGRSS